MDEFGAPSPYASDWSLGAALGSVGVIWLGDIPLPQAREIVAAGGQVYGQPLPPEAPPAVEMPPPSPAPPASPPATQPPPVEPAPPLEGEVIPGPGSDPRTIFEDYGDVPFDPEDPAHRGYRPIIEGEPGPPPPRGIGRPTRAPDLPIPPWVLRGLPRGAIGGIGGVIIGATFPEELGSGELPFPPIPRVSIPEPQVTPRVDLPPLPEPAAPVFNAPPLPDVVVVSAPAPDSSSLPRASSSPSVSSRPGLGAILGTILGSVLAPRLTPRARGVPTPEQFVNPLPTPAPITNTLTPPTPIPTVDPLTPPAGEFLPGTTPAATPEGLTLPQPLTADFGAPQITDPTRTRECDCNEPGQRKKRKKPRKCLTRANLIWAGGPKSGKPAGSRCVKFEDYLP